MKESFKNTPCYEIYKELNKTCDKKKCRYWHDLNGNSNNCILNKSECNSHTLQEIGDLLNLTRMRVCQIEKGIIKKIKNI